MISRFLLQVSFVFSTSSFFLIPDGSTQYAAIIDTRIRKNRTPKPVYGIWSRVSCLNDQIGAVTLVYYQINFEHTSIDFETSSRNVFYWRSCGNTFSPSEWDHFLFDLEMVLRQRVQSSRRHQTPYGRLVSPRHSASPKSSRGVLATLKTEHRNQRVLMTNAERGSIGKLGFRNRNIENNSDLNIYSKISIRDRFRLLTNVRDSDCRSTSEAENV